ncbi:PIN domain-containing protein [Candidatus Bathyarchaeota archaeon]|nr:PIN domain-containing protein [Candidatus Bathyarchaeota archaeon]
MKSKQATLKVLLDTSFILPTLGIDVGEDVIKSLKKLTDIEAEVYYSRFSILESLWVATRLSESLTFNSERFSHGLRSIIESGRYGKVEEDSETFKEALRLRMLGHKDMIDNILYATSSSLNLKLLTLDTELKQFIHDKGLKDILILPSQIT